MPHQMDYLDQSSGYTERFGVRQVDIVNVATLDFGESDSQALIIYDEMYVSLAAPKSFQRTGARPNTKLTRNASLGCIDVIPA